MMDIKYIFLVIIGILLYCPISAQHDWDRKDWNKNSIGFGCNYSGEQTRPVKKVSQFLIKGRYNKVKNMLSSEIPANQFISVFVLEKLILKNVIALELEERRQIIDIKNSADLVPVCCGCSYFSEMPLSKLFASLNKHENFIGAESWFKYYYSIRNQKEQYINTDSLLHTDTTVYNFFELDRAPILITDSAEYMMNNIETFICKQLQYPENGNDCAGRVYISFIVEKDGSISHKKYERRLCVGFDEEAMRVINSLEHWKPGLKDNKPVRVKVLIPINWMFN